MNLNYKMFTENETCSLGGRGGVMMGGGIRLQPQGTLAHFELGQYLKTGVKKKLNGFNYI